MITMNLKDLPEELTEEEKKMLERAEKASITFDEDCPELTEEQLKQFRRVSERRKSENRKETVTLRLSAKSLRKAKSLEKCSGVTDTSTEKPENRENLSI